MKELLDFWRPTDQENTDNIFHPSMEVYETEKAYKLKFDLPGFNQEQIKIDIRDNELLIAGERNKEMSFEDKDSKAHISELIYGNFQRSFRFPTEVDAEGVQANYDNGVLVLTVEKKKPRQAKQIAIN